MTELIKKSMVFLVILILTLGGINNLYINTDRYKSANATEKFDHVPMEIEVANLGTSHAQYAFLFDDVERTSFNFALPAQRLHYDNKILDKYIENFKEGSTLFIPISYISFYLGYDDKDENFQKYNKVYYKILGPRDIKQLTLSDYLKYGVLPLLTAESNIKYIVVEDEKEYKPWYEQDKMDYTIPQEKMREESKKTAETHHDFIEKGQAVKDENILIVEDIIQKCLDNNIIPIMITTPVTKYYSEHFSEIFYNDFENSISSVLDKYPGVRYLDYSHDERFINNTEYFFDSSHLNVTGAKLFTKIILEDIE
ncbi:MAG TPA: SGNH/GDSL hydrolase family protein [Epulopiscium sp.]|nr:SGNH/GDSL hydrolase family protein [Candidatus Epulonipiscium sp.]